LLLDGRYRLVDRLGAGGMATVWGGVDEQLNRGVAIKVLAENLAADPSYVKRFKREARVAAGLAHPNLVAVYDFGEHDERPYLVMELIEGDSLAQRSAAQVSDIDASRLAVELLSAVEHIHKTGIVHRDIKPANVLLSHTGWKLTDFGIAQPADATQLTKTGMVVGTRSYIAPEVMRGRRATVRSDLYSLGVLLGEVVQDRAPASLRQLAEVLTQEDPDQRPASAAAALSQLKQVEPSTAVAPTEPLAGTSASRTIPLRRKPRSKRTLAIAALALAAVAAAVVWGPSDGERSKVSRSTAAPPPAGDSARNPENQPVPNLTESGGGESEETGGGGPPDGSAAESSDGDPASGPAAHSNAGGNGSGSASKPKKGKGKGAGEK